MLQQNFYPSRLIKVVPSDTINIPNPGSATISGTTTSTIANRLVDSAQDFSAGRGNPVSEGDIVMNTRDDTIATVTGIPSPNVLSLSADIMTTAETYTIYRKNRNLGCIVYVTSIDRNIYTIAGITPGGDSFKVDLPYNNFAGTLNSIVLPFQVLRINATGSTLPPKIEIFALFN